MMQNNKIEATNEKDRETLNKWRKITGIDAAQNVDPLRFERFCFFYENVNGCEPTEEVKSHIKSHLLFLKMEEMVAEYEQINKAVFG